MLERGSAGEKLVMGLKASIKDLHLMWAATSNQWREMKKGALWTFEVVVQI